MSADPLATVAALLEELSPTVPHHFRGITMLPLRARSPRTGIRLITGDTALLREREGGARVREVSVENRTDAPLLLLAGELLVGAKQNRVVERSMLAPPGERVPVRVSCVERLRWACGPRGDTLQPLQATVPWTMRDRLPGSSAPPTASVGRRRPAAWDQSTVWAEVDQTLTACGVDSATADLVAAVPRIDPATLLGGWSPGPFEVGAAFFRGTEPMGFEVFGCRDAFEAALPHMLSGVVVEGNPHGAPPPLLDEAFGALRDHVRGMNVVVRPAPSLGDEVEGTRGRHRVAALVWDDAVVHLRAAVLRRPFDLRKRRRPRIRRLGEGLDPLDRAVRIGIEAAGRLAADKLRIHGGFLVTPEARLRAVLRAAAALGGLPLPHGVGGGLAIWHGERAEDLQRVLEALSALGVPPDDCFLAVGAALEAFHPPGWIGHASLPDGGRTVWLVP